MIGVSESPCSSSAARRTPTRPSIMSLGAMTSAPAAACETAVRASSSSVASLSTYAVLAQHAAVAVRRVLAQAQVGDDEQVGVGGLDRARGELDDALVVPRAGALLVLVGGQAEEQHAGDAERGGDARLLDGAVDREVVDAGQRGDRAAALAAAGDDEHGGDQVRDRQLGLAHQPAQDAGLAQAPEAGRGEGHASSVGFARRRCSANRRERADTRQRSERDRQDRQVQQRQPETCRRRSPRRARRAPA